MSIFATPKIDTTSKVHHTEYIATDNNPGDLKFTAPRISDLALQQQIDAVKDRTPHKREMFRRTASELLNV